MRTAVKWVQLLVGLLFIVSGLVKANDPVGLGYKMQEFFELWSEGLSKDSVVAVTLNFLHGAALPLSVAMITVEVLAGVALLLGWQRRLVLWLLLVLIVFFSFLTGYAYLSGKFTNCGCFGDCLPISPLASFLKDLLLLLLIGFLLARQRFVQALLAKPKPAVLLLLALAITLGLQAYVLNYLPLADCLPFKKGSHLPTAMKPPPGSRPDSVVIKYIYTKGGKRYEWAANELPADFNTYTFVDRVDRVVRKGNAEPAIKGFVLVGAEGTDSANVVLQQPQAVLVFSLSFDDETVLRQLAELQRVALQRNVPLYLVTANRDAALAAFAANKLSAPPVYNTDFTVVRTVARTSPTVLFLSAGTVTEKFSANQLEKASRQLANPQP